ncbi:MAG: hypothetical protein ACHQAX_09760 [Gammaproteobacteria bacterium]
MLDCCLTIFISARLNIGEVLSMGGNSSKSENKPKSSSQNLNKRTHPDLTQQPYLTHAFKPSRKSNSQQFEIQVTPNLHNDSYIHKYIERQRYWMEYLNAAPHIIYPNDVSAIFPNQSFEKLRAQSEEQLKSYGIESAVDGIVYTYRGLNPAEAIDNLLKIKPLFLECGSAITLTAYLALKDVIGAEKFNQIIKVIHNNELVIKLKSLPYFYTTTRYIRSLEETQEGMPLFVETSDFQAGNIVGIEGPIFGQAFHPASELNAYNLLWCENDGFLGFSSWNQPIKTQAEFIGLLENAYQKNLSNGDLRFIHQLYNEKPNEYADFSTLSHKQVYDLIFNENLVAYNVLSTFFKEGKINKHEVTTVPVPEAFKNISSAGAVCCHKLDPNLFSFYIHGNKNAISMAMFKEGDCFIDKSRLLLPYPPAAELDFKSFSQDKTYQQKIVSEVTHFYYRSLDRISRKQMGGLVLQGNPGTGKTTACAIMLDALEKKGIRIWRAYLEKPVLEEKVYIELTQMKLYSQKSEAELIRKLILHMIPQWQGYDVYFMDDLNGGVGEYSLVARALIVYCRENQKQFLVTTNAIFSNTFNDPPHVMLWFRMATILGEDYRIKHAWWNGLVQDRKKITFNEPVLNVTQTPDQDYLMHCLAGLFSANATCGLWVNGKPGIGKTTLIEAYFKKHQIDVLKITPKNNPKESLEKIKAFAGAYIWLEDVNDTGFGSNLEYIFEHLLDMNEKKESSIVRKIVVTSNALSSEKAVHDFTCILKSNLKERYKSRMQSIFFSINLQSIEDFRKNQTDKKSCFIRHASDPSGLPDPYIFAISNWHNEMAADKNKVDFVRRQSYRERANKILESAASVRLVWDEEPGYAFIKYELALLLDGMETEQKSLEIVLPDSMPIDTWFKTVEKEYNDSFNADRFMYMASRLNRVQTITSVDQVSSHIDNTKMRQSGGCS